jgi:hypothetical protein
VSKEERREAEPDIVEKKRALQHVMFQKMVSWQKNTINDLITLILGTFEPFLTSNENCAKKSSYYVWFILITFAKSTLCIPLPPVKKKDSERVEEWSESQLDEIVT